MWTPDVDRRDILPILLLCFVYGIIYIPRTLGPNPLIYRANVQKNAQYVASSFAQGSVPYTPPYPDFYSTAGGHLHGVFGALFQFFFNFSTAYRLGALIMGFCSLFVFYTILRRIGVSRTSGWLATGLLSIYPQYILFHAGVNPAAADIFFGLIAVYAYLRWRSEEGSQWLLLSCISSGAATFSHFYSGVVAIGILSHYLLTTEANVEDRFRTIAAYSLGLLPALALLVGYKAVFVQSDPNSHYFSRLIINSFGTVYYTETAFDSGFSMLSLEFLSAIMDQHSGRSPILGDWFVSLTTGVVLAIGAYFNDVNDGGILLLTWVVSGSLIVILIPGGVIYHDYYTWWLLMGLIASVAWSIDGILRSLSQKTAWTL